MTKQVSTNCRTVVAININSPVVCSKMKLGNLLKFNAAFSPMWGHRTNKEGTEQIDLDGDGSDPNWIKDEGGKTIVDLENVPGMKTRIHTTKNVFQKQKGSTINSMLCSQREERNPLPLISGMELLQHEVTFPMVPGVLPSLVTAIHLHRSRLAYSGGGAQGQLDQCNHLLSTNSHSHNSHLIHLQLSLQQLHPSNPNPLRKLELLMRTQL